MVAGHRESKQNPRSHSVLGLAHVCARMRTYAHVSARVRACAHARTRARAPVFIPAAARARQEQRLPMPPESSGTQRCPEVFQDFHPLNLGAD